MPTPEFKDGLLPLFHQEQVADQPRKLTQLLQNSFESQSPNSRRGCASALFTDCSEVEVGTSGWIIANQLQCEVAFSEMSGLFTAGLRYRFLCYGQPRPPGSGITLEPAQEKQASANLPDSGS